MLFLLVKSIISVLFWINLKMGRVSQRVNLNLQKRVKVRRVNLNLIRKVKVNHSQTTKMFNLTHRILRFLTIQVNSLLQETRAWHHSEKNTLELCQNGAMMKAQKYLWEILSQTTHWSRRHQQENLQVCSKWTRNKHRQLQKM